VPGQVKRNVIYGFIAHLRMGAILQTSINTSIRNAG